MKSLNQHLKILLFFGLLLIPSSVQAQAARVDLEALHGSITTGTATCAATATIVPATNLSGRRSIAFVNISDSDIYIGKSTVTTANGFELASNTGFSADAGDEIQFYCISSAGGKEIRYMEIR